MTNIKKTLITTASLTIAVAPILTTISCGKSTTITPIVSEAQIKADSAAMKLKTDFTGFSTDSIRIIGHKQEALQASKSVVEEFNKAFGTKLIIEQIGGTTNYSQYLTTKFASGAGDIGLVQFELQGELAALGSHAVDTTGEFLGESSSTITLGGKKVIPSVSESLGVIYNKDLFNELKITVQEGKSMSPTVSDDGVEANAANDALTVWTSDLTAAGFAELATYIRTKKGSVAPFYSTSKTQAGNIWPYTNHLLSSALKANGLVSAPATNTAENAITADVLTTVKGALDIYRSQGSSDLPTNTVDEAMGKVAAGAVAMSQNGTWAIESLLSTNPDGEFGFLPKPIFSSSVTTAKLMKGVTQNWVMTTSTDAKQKTIQMFLKWLYKTSTGIDAQYNAFQSETPFALSTGVIPNIKNQLQLSAAKYSGDAVLNGGLSLSWLPSGFNNDSQALRTAFASDDITAQLGAIRTEYTDALNKTAS